MTEEVLTLEERHLYSGIVESLIEKASVLTEALDEGNPLKNTFLETFESIIDDLYQVIMGLPCTTAVLDTDDNQNFAVPSVDLAPKDVPIITSLQQEESLST